MRFVKITPQNHTTQMNLCCYNYQKNYCEQLTNEESLAEVICWYENYGNVPLFILCI